MLLNDINQHDTSLKPRYGKGFLWYSVKTMGRSLHAVLASRKTVGGIRTAGCSHTIVVHQIQLEKLREFITLTGCSFLCVCDSERVKASAWSHRTESVYLNVCFHNDTLWQESTVRKKNRQRKKPASAACEHWQQGHVQKSTQAHWKRQQNVPLATFLQNTKCVPIHRLHITAVSNWNEH